jgi:hypothetical protein
MNKVTKTTTAPASGARLIWKPRRHLKGQGSRRAAVLYPKKVQDQIEHAQLAQQQQEMRVQCTLSREKKRGHLRASTQCRPSLHHLAQGTSKQGSAHVHCIS